MSDYQQLPLSDICADVSYGYTESATNDEVGPKFLRITDIQGGVVDWKNVPFCPIDEEKLDKYLLAYGDIVVARTGNSTGENYAYKGLEKSVFASYLIRFRIDKSKANPFFVWYQMRSRRWWEFVAGAKSGSAQAGANAKVLGKFEIFLPSLAIQDAIAKQLEDIDNKIQLNTQTNQTLEQIAQAIFKSWFVDYDPVRAKMAALEEGGTPEAALFAAMRAISAKDAAALKQMQRETPEAYAQLAQTAALFPSTMEESELGEVPEGWEVAKVSDFGTVVCGKTPSKKKHEYYGSDIPFIKIPDMHGNVFVTKTTECLSIEGANSQKKKQIPKDSICVSCIATVGKVVIASEDSHTNQQINSIVPQDKAYTYYLFFKMQSMDKLLHDLASGGSATLNLNTGNFSKIELLKPKDGVIELFATRVQALFEKILTNAYENDSLEKVRDSLLPKLLSGELEIN